MSTITRQQLADLICGIGSCYISSGAYNGESDTQLIGQLFRLLGDHIRSAPTDTYTVPPVRQ